MSDMLERVVLGLRQALAVTPRNGPLWLQLAEVLAEVGRENEAADAARHALPLVAPGSADEARARALLDDLDPPAAADPADDDGKVIRLVRGGRAGDALPPPLRDGVRITFADVGGLDALKETIRLRIVLPFERPEVFAAYGRKQGGGILLYGPPGCGKTLLARATAGECRATFQNVAIENVLDMWWGESEKKLSGLFAEARQHAPTVLFFDEVEAIGASRQQIRHSPGKTLVNQLLSEMDGVTGGTARLLVMGATNAPWHVDPALRRPGRFDRVIFVPPPDAAARVEVLRLHLRGRPVDPGVDLSDLATRTEDFSGADLLDLVERAVETPLKEALRTGAVRPLTAADFKGALASARPSTREWFATAKNYATFANTGGLYDDLLAYVESRPRK